MTVGGQRPPIMTPGLDNDQRKTSSYWSIKVIIDENMPPGGQRPPKTIPLGSMELHGENNWNPT